MRIAFRSIAATLLFAPALVAGCEGSLERDERPRVTLDDAGASGADAGAASDPCEGLSEAGECSGDRARWCEGGELREQDCAAGGEVCGVVSGRQRCTTPPPEECSDPVEQEQLRITNAERTRAGLAPLVCDPGLTRAARKHSQDMCDQGYFDHDSLDGRTFRDRIDAEGVRWSRIGENIARGQPSPQAVHDAWMGSTGHRANIMSADFGRIGIGHVACGGQGPYWTQDFAN